MKFFKNLSVWLLCAAILAPVLLRGAEVEIADLTDVYYAGRASLRDARELAAYLGKIFGKRFNVKRAKDSSKKGFYVGKAFAPKDIKIENREQIFRKVDEDGKIFLWSAENSKKIPGDSRAVTTFLEDVCGVRWLWPTASGEVIPRHKSIKVKTGFSTEKPAFGIRILKYGAEKEWVRRMKLGQSIGYVTGHSFSKWFPPEQYFEKHPEYYSLVSAANWIGSSDKPAVAARTSRQLCTSNPEVRRLLAEKIAAKNLDVMQSISPNDGYAFCECANCRAQDSDPNWKSIYANPHLSDRMYDFTRDVALQAKKLNPKSKVIFLAYAFYEQPPKKVFQMPDNVYVLRCLWGPSLKDRQKVEKEFEYYKKSGIKLWLYEYWGTYNHGMPWNVPHFVAWETKLLRSVNGFGFRVENNANFSNSGLTNYVGAKLMWNPDADVDAIIDDFCRAGFGNAAEPMRKYFDLTEEYTMKLQKIWGGYRKVLRNVGVIFNEEFFRKGDELFKKALKSKITPEERARILYVKSGFEYGRISARWSRMLSQVNAHGGNLPLVLPAVEEPAEINDKMLFKLFSQASKLCEARINQSLAGSMRKDFSVTYKTKLEYNLWHMPYKFMIQHLMKGVQLGFFNYFVNNAFELTNAPEFNRPVFGWNIDGKKYEVTLQDCHDDIHDITAMYHARQGKSLCITLAPQETATVTSTVKVVLNSGTRMLISGYFKNGIPEVAVNFDVDGKAVVQKLAVGAMGLKENSNWQQITYTPFVFPQGKKVAATVTFTVRNDTKTEQKVFLDDLKFIRAK